MIGHIYHHPHYKFADGQEGNKLFVIIAHSPCTKYILVVKTTSQPKTSFPQNPTECLESGKYFFIRENYDSFPKSTWVDFTTTSFKEMEASELLTLSMRGSVAKKGELTQNTVGAMKNCLKRCRYISQKHLDWVLMKKV